LPKPIRTVGIATAAHKPQVVPTAGALCEALRAAGRPILLGPCAEDVCSAACVPPDEVVSLAKLANTDLVISLGGDGTLLAVAGHAGPKGTPLLGVDLGSFGFLAAEDFQTVLDQLEHILQGDYETDRRLMVAAQVVRNGRTVSQHCGLNEAVIGKTDVRRLVRLLTKVDGEHMATYPADGLIISTPTGSTAYGLSAGGPIVSPAVESLIITPICSHTLYSRPLVVEPSAIIEVAVSSRGGPAVGISLALDGQETVELAPGDSVRVFRASFDARLVRVSAGSFYERLRTKLHWDAER